MCRVDRAVVAPRLMAELNLSQLEMGKVFSAFLLGYTLFQVPSGWLAGRASTRRLFGALALGWAAITGAHGLVRWETPRLCRGGSRSLTNTGVPRGNSLT